MFGDKNKLVFKFVLMIKEVFLVFFVDDKSFSKEKIFFDMKGELNNVENNFVLSYKVAIF